MPRARNETTGSEAEAFDAAVRALDRAEKAYKAAREAFHAAFIAAAEREHDPMGLSEAARRSGYSREYLSKLYAKITGHALGQWQHTAPAKRTARELIADKPARRRKPQLL